MILKKLSEEFENQRLVEEYLVALESISRITKASINRASVSTQTKIRKVKDTNQLKANASNAVRANRHNVKHSAMEDYSILADLNADETRELKRLLEDNGY